MDRFDFEGAIAMHKAWKMKFHLALDRISGADYDTRPLAAAIAAAQSSGRPVANDGFYHDQFHFAGRLRTPLVAFEDEGTMADWLEQHPEALAVVYVKNEKRLAGRRAIVVHGYLGGVAALLEAQEAVTLLRGR